MNLSRMTRLSLFSAISVLSLTSAAIAGTTSYVSNGTGGGDFDDPLTWIPNGVPTLSTSDSIEIVNGDVVLSSATVNSADSVTISDGTLIVQGDFVLKSLDLTSNSGFLEAFDGNFYFTGDSSDPARIMNDQRSDVIINGLFVTGPGTTPDVRDFGKLVFDNSFLRIEEFYQVGISSEVEFSNDSSIEFQGDFTDPSKYSYRGDSTLSYTGPGSNFSPFDEWRPDQFFTAKGAVSQSPDNVILRQFVNVDLRQETGVFTINTLFLDEFSILELPDDDNFVDVNVLFTSEDESQMIKVIKRSDLLTSGTLIDFGATELLATFRAGSFNDGEVENIEVVRRGNEGPLSGTFTEESFDLTVTEFFGQQSKTLPGTPIPLQELSLPSRGFTFLNQEVIFNRINPFDFFDALSPSITNPVGPDVVYSSPTSPTDIMLEDRTTATFFLNDGLINTLVEVEDFTVTLNENGSIAIRWETAAEFNNTGFNLYRGDVVDNEIVQGERMNSTVVPSFAAGNGSGSQYVLVDPVRAEVGEFRAYYLEDIDLNGVRTLHGPVGISAESKKKSD